MKKNRSIISILKKDFYRWNSSSFIKLYLTKIEFRLVWRYRWCNYFKTKIIFKPIYYCERFLYHKTCIKAGCDIPSSVSIGAGFMIIHTWGIVINSKAEIGDDFTILTGSVIGANEHGVPKIKNNVFCGAHSLIIGNVVVEDNAKIGAGAIVTKNVTRNSVVCNSPAKKIK